MDCPQCKASISALETSCPKCACDIAVFQKISALEYELKQSRSLLEGKFSLLEGITSELKAGLQGSIEPGKPISAVPTPQVTGTPFATPPPEIASTPQDRNVSTSGLDKPRVENVQGPRTDELALGQKWLLISGIVITVFGIGYFLKFSFEQNWIGPAARVALGYVASLALLGAGERFRRIETYRSFGLTLVGGGIAALYFSTFAGYQIYHLFDQILAFGLMILTTILAGKLALKYDHKPIAVLGLIGGFITPLLLDSGSGNYQALFTYLVVLNLGILTISFFKQWSVLNTLGFFFTWAIFSAWYTDSYSNEKFWWATLFLNAFFVIYAAVPFAFYTLKRREEPLNGFAISIPNAAIAFFLSYLSIKQNAGLPAVGIISLSYAALYLFFAQLLYRRDPGNMKALVPLLGQAAVFLVVTVPIVASTEWVTVFWAIQCAVLFWAALRLGLENLYRGAFLLLVATLFRFVAVDYGSVINVSYNYYAHDYITHPFNHHVGSRLLAAISVLGSIGMIATLLATYERTLTFVQSGHKTILWSLFGGLLFLVLNRETQMFVVDYSIAARSAAISVLWTLFSIGLIALGFNLRISALRKCALVLFGLTILRVFTVDMANVSAPFRILSFVVLGIVLIFASFLYYRYRDRIT